MDNGDIMNWRTYRDVKTGKNEPFDPTKRFIMI
jgi:hypothetical protein